MVKKFVILMTDENGEFKDFASIDSFDDAEKAIEHFISLDTAPSMVQYRIETRYSKIGIAC